ncbi:MAG: HigA family addiction module antitoxin [Sphingomicrobium sp.]|nr:HigA family addiction module antidote protein [Sphingomonadales bacterium]
MSGSRTIIAEEDRLDNVHPGDILREDFLVGSEIPAREVAEGSGLELAVIEALIACQRDVDAVTDVRLARYFGMSEGFFLGLQNDYDLEEVHRREGDALDRIVPRAA